MKSNENKKIQILKDEIINKIAAGEVVERPASIVKELIENSIDAGASQITVELEEGGKKSLKIIDNGHGISKNDLELSIVRHATSKIEEIGDLFSVNTMGFRGEALASISAVSRFSLISKAKVSKTAYKLSFDSQEKIHEVQEWSHSQGTTIVVKDLFYNVPVRLKFLRSAQTEFSHCLEFIQNLSLANPHVSFIVSHNGKEKFSTGGLTGSLKTFKETGFWGEEVLRKKIAAIYGEDLSEKLLYLKTNSDYLRFESLISPPGFEKASSKSMFSFVNRRWVKDKVIRYGILRGYHSHLLKGRYPYALCFLSLSPELVDVNVHPSKTELRFQYAEDVQGEMARAIRERLRKEDWAESKGGFQAANLSSSLLEESTAKKEVPFSSGDISSSILKSLRAASPSSYSSFSQKRAPSAFFNRQASLATSVELPDLVAPSEQEMEQESSKEFVSETTSFEPEAKDVVWFDWDKAFYRGSIFKCYLIFEFEGKVLFVDQHAFHERIIYERLCLDKRLLSLSQALMIPEVLSFEPTVIAALLEKKEILAEASFTFEKISEEEIEVTSVPSLLTEKNLRNVFLELSRDNGLKGAEEFNHLLLATIACHSAVRAGEELTLDKIAQLKEEAKEVDFSANCPHGRRVFKWLNENEVAKWFDRL